MDLNYKTIIKIEGVTSKPIGSVGIKLDLSLNRNITDDEVSVINRGVNDILKYLNKNTLLNDPYKIAVRAEEKTDLLACFSQPIYVKEIPNEYYSESVDPWFLVTTTKGLIKIGWRKRVIEIDWSDSDIKHNGNTIFANESTTIDKTYVHAWNYEKAKEYLDKLLK